MSLRDTFKFYHRYQGIRNIYRVIFDGHCIIRVIFDKKNPSMAFVFSEFWARFLGQSEVSWVKDKLDLIVSGWICTSSNKVGTVLTIRRMCIREMILKIICFIMIEVQGGNGSRMSARREQSSEQW